MFEKGWSAMEFQFVQAYLDPRDGTRTRTRKIVGPRKKFQTDDFMTHPAPPRIVGEKLERL